MSEPERATPAPFVFPEPKDFYPLDGFEEPPAWAGLARTAKGFAVPWVCMTHDGGYNISYPNPKRLAQCVRGSRCAVCGEPLGYWLSLIGDDRDFETRLFRWPAMHRACALASAFTCPHLMLRGALLLDEQNAVFTHDASPSETALPRMGIFTTREQSIDHVRLLVKTAPLKLVQWLNAPGDAPHGSGVFIEEDLTRS